jgi:3-oxoacyl-[acyl-carrier protein] reductase
MSRYFERAVDLTGKTAIVTDADRSLGASIAKALAADGARVVVACASNEEAIGSLAAGITAGGGRALAVKADVTDVGDVQRLLAETERTFGRLHILVTNSSLHGHARAAPSESEALLGYYNRNVLRLLQTASQAEPHFAPEGGSVFNIAGVVANPGLRDSALQATTDAIVDTAISRLSKSFEPKGIRVHSIKIDVQTPRPDGAPPGSADVVRICEDRLVETLSNSVRFWALRLESGTVRIRHSL